MDKYARTFILKFHMCISLLFNFHFSGGDGKYTEIDQLVLNYIGIESAVLEGLPVAETKY